VSNYEETSMRMTSASEAIFQEQASLVCEVAN
jgi:hypothetical protein